MRFTRCIAIGILLAVIALQPLLAQSGTDRKTSYALEQYEAGNEAAAIRFLIQLAYQGNVAAQFNLGIINLSRDDAAAGRKEAQFWFQEAADAGDISAQYNLGMLLHEVAVIPEQRSESLQWLERSAEGGKVAAQTNLGILRHVLAAEDSDRVAARQWLTLAAQSGDSLASQALQVLGEVGNSYQLQELMQPLDLDLRAEVDRGASEVLTDNAAIYPMPSTGLQPLANVARESKVEVVEKRDGWVQVRTGSGLPLWTPADDIDVLGERAVVRRLEAPLYARPEIDPEVVKLGTLTKGEKVRVLRSNAEWLQVEAPPRFAGWMREADVAIRVSSLAARAPQQPRDTVAAGGQSPSPALNTLRALPANPRPVDAEDSRAPGQLLADTPIFLSPDAGAPRRGVGLEGTRVTVTKRVDGFAFVSAPAAAGWIFSGLVDVQASPSSSAAGSGLINRTGARVRAAPGLESAVLSQLSRGDSVTILQVGDGWIQLDMPSRTGWVAESMVAIDQSRQDPASELTEPAAQASAGQPVGATEVSSPDATPEPATGTAAVATSVVSASTIVYSDATVTSKPLGRLSVDIEVDNPLAGSGSSINMLPVPGGNPLYAWIYATLVEPNQADADFEAGPVAATVTGSRVRVRLDPTTTRDNIVTSFDRGTPVQLLGLEDDWYRVLLPSAAGYAAIIQQ